MSKIFLKINLKFYSNITTQPNLWICLVIQLQHILFSIINTIIPVVILIPNISKDFDTFITINSTKLWRKNTQVCKYENDDWLHCRFHVPRYLSPFIIPVVILVPNVPKDFDTFITIDSNKLWRKKTHVCKYGNDDWLHCRFHVPHYLSPFIFFWKDI